MTELTPVTSDSVRLVLRTSLMKRVGQGRPLSAEAVAMATGYSVSSIKRIREGEMEPSLAGLLSLATVLGPDFLNDILILAGFRAEADDADGCRVEAALASVAGFTAILAEALADGRIDHREGPVLLTRAEALAHELADLIHTLRTMSHASARPASAPAKAIRRSSAPRRGKK